VNRSAYLQSAELFNPTTDTFSSTTRAATAAVLSRGPVIYATGSAVDNGKGTKLLLTPLRRIDKGSYRLTLSWTVGRVRHTTRRTLMLA
jgi:hypothetical protein